MGRMSNAMQSTPAVGCMKCLLMIFNFVFWVSGLAILALGVWMKLELYMYMELTTFYYNNAPYILIGVGSAIVVVGLLGCFCTIKAYKAPLIMFAIFLGLIFAAELAMGAGGLFYRDKLQEGFKAGLNDALTKYGNDTIKTEAVDGIQSGLKCCGILRYQDWYDTAWEKQQPQPRTVPQSCCKTVACKNGGLPKNNGTSDIIYTEGCFAKVTVFMKANFNFIGWGLIGFAFLQLFGATLSGLLATNANKSNYEKVQ